MLEVHVQKQLGGFSVDAAFTVPNVGITALFGHSGAGKTSVIDMVGGLTRPDSGRIVIDGRVLFDADSGVDVPVHRRRLGYVFQEARLFPHLTVAANLTYGLRHVPAGEEYTDIDEVVSVLGVSHLLHRRPGTLSGGEKQRIAIGRALMTSPRLLLMDEPLASLDGPRKNELIPYIVRMAQAFRLPILYVTHSMDEIMRLADSAVIMDGGRAIASGPVEEVFTGRADASGVMTVMPARVVRVDDDGVTEFSFAGGMFFAVRSDLAPGAEVRLRVAGADVVIATRKPEGLSVRNVFPGTVTSVSDAPDGTGVIVAVDIGCTLYARISRRAATELSITEGMQVHALVKAAGVNRGDASSR